MKTRIVWRPYVLTWIALLILLGLSAGSAFLALGMLNVVTNFAIAALKAALVAAVFMRLGRSAPMVRVAAAAGVLWLALLIGFGIVDFLARRG